MAYKENEALKAEKDSTRYKVFLYVFWFLMILALVIPLYPFLAWEKEPSKDINTLILDYTVPNMEYREHNGVTWIINNLKIVKKDGSAYDLRKDYYGFFPRKNHTYTLKLPSGKALKDAGLIYIADTYGVYAGDFSGHVEIGKRSKLMFGGLEEADAARISASLTGGKVLVAEFNTFGSPTKQPAREIMYKTLNLDWTGWAGRYFANLKKETGDLPAWAPEVYKKQYGKEWNFSGPGFIIIHENDTILVLKAGTDLSSNDLTLSFTQKGKDFIPEDPPPAKYMFWFDIIAPRPGTGILAEYTLHLTDEGRKKLKQFNLTETFPAITVNKTPDYTAYYLAGDYADNNDTPKSYKYAYTFSGIIAMLASGGTSNEYNDYFIKDYLPFMHAVFKNTNKSAEK